MSHLYIVMDCAILLCCFEYIVLFYGLPAALHFKSFHLASSRDVFNILCISASSHYVIKCLYFIVVRCSVCNALCCFEIAVTFFFYVLLYILVRYFVVLWCYTMLIMLIRCGWIKKRFNVVK